MAVSQVLAKYKLALLKLETNPSSEHVLAVLLIRDQLQALLAQESELLPRNLIELEELDGRLKKHKSNITKLGKLSARRSLLEPPEKHWWWYFPSQWEYLGVVKDFGYNVLVIIALTFSLSLLVNTSTRLLSSGVSSNATFAVLGQSVLALLVGGTFTQPGREAIEATLKRKYISKNYWQLISLGLSVGLVVLVSNVNDRLPIWAIAVNREGLEKYDANKIESAKADFERAIAMRPDFAEARYNLGVLYEQLNDFDKAKAQYELAAHTDPQKFIDPITYLKANNNLGRLYILKKEYAIAMQFLKRGLPAVDTVIDQLKKTYTDAKVLKQEIHKVENVHYNLLKNMGWARLGQERYQEAINSFDEAIALDKKRSAAHCLKAQIWEKQKDSEKAEKAWKFCLSDLDPSNPESTPEEDDWYGLGNKYLSRGK